MSYCRWSTDDFQCDLYCYEDCNGGYTTHVAASRYVYKEPLPPDVDPLENFDAWYARHEKVMAMVDAAESVDIGLPYDGQTFNDPDLESFLDRIVDLKAAGYRFPDYVIEAVKNEWMDTTTTVNPD